MQELRIGGVLRRASTLLRRHPGLLGVAVLLVAVPQVIALALPPSMAPDHPGLFGISRIVPWLCSLLLQAVVIRVGIDDANRETSKAGQLAGAAARSFFPLLGLSLLSGICIGFASVLLIVPGAVLFCRWYVVIPVQVAEQSGVIRSFDRSAHLTYGVRWRVLGLVLIAGLIGLILALGTGVIGGFFAALSHNRWPDILGQAIGLALLTLLPALVTTAAYLDLREIKEGAFSEDLVAVFD